MEEAKLGLGRRLYQYQLERFPLVFLLPTTLAIIVSTMAVLEMDGYQAEWWKYALLAVAGLSFLLHTRVIDELRDKEVDDVHHPNRPLQRGLITEQEILRVGYLNGGIFISIHIVLDPLSGLLSAGLLLYSILARYEVGPLAKLKPHFWLYNVIMLMQMLLLQLVAYAAISKTLQWSENIWWHAFGVFALSALVEAARKCLPPEEETAYRDSYSSRLGIRGSAIVTVLIGLLSMWCYAQIPEVSQMYLWLATLPLFLGALRYANKPDKNGKNSIQAGAVLTYLFLNVVVWL